MRLRGGWEARLEGPECLAKKLGLFLEGDGESLKAVRRE